MGLIVLWAWSFIHHAGIITNYKDIKQFLSQKGYKFESDTDTEIIAKLIRHLYSLHPNYSFLELVEGVIQQLVSGFSSLHPRTISSLLIAVILLLHDKLLKLHNLLFIPFCDVVTQDGLPSSTDSLWVQSPVIIIGNIRSIAAIMPKRIVGLCPLGQAWWLALPKAICQSCSL